MRVQRIALEHHRQVALARGLVGDVAAVQHQGAAVDIFEPRNQPQQRGLATARGADEDDELALLDGEVDALDGAMLTKEFLDAAQLKVGHGIGFLKS
ncbi:hypothetical protein D3C71_1607410 [compost metagenome]